MLKEEEYEPLNCSIISQSQSTGEAKNLLELEASTLIEPAHPLTETAGEKSAQSNGNLHADSVSPASSESEDSTEVTQEPIVLAHNPSLKKRLSRSTQRRHQRSASDFVDQQSEEPIETNFDDTEPVPLDPVVHPPEEQHSAELNEFKSVPSVSTQRSLKRVTDVSPLHERVAPNLASKNLLVKVVKADFIELKSKLKYWLVYEL